MVEQSNSCKAKNKQGKSCRAPATEGGYCHFHANPDRAAELGRAGGRKNRHAMDDAIRPLPAMDTVSGMKDAVLQTIEDVHANRLSPKTAAGLAAMFNTLLRMQGQSDLEQRIKRLEKQVIKNSGAVSTGLPNETEEDPHLQN
jgi:hypothetical protein